ncbi:MAG: Stp1/IreP family PP2C-type Ser/Thr phosphatase [Lachnospiraceae bacterium]
MKVFGLSDKGICREQNQDSFYYLMKPCGMLSTLFLVADGMGGHLAGDVASKYTVEHLPNYIARSKKDNLQEVMKEAIQNVSKDILALSQRYSEYRGMGTTLVAATIQNHSLYIANVGDSRAYHLRNGRLRQVTKDHSWVEELVERGEIQRGSEFYQKNKNVITRVVGGVRGQAMPDFFECTLQEHDMVLMCSDGLSNMVTDRRMEEILNEESSIEEKARNLIDEANFCGGLDNITVLLIEIDSEVIQ